MKMEKFQIVEYQDQYHQAFKELSLEWLQKYASVEPEDELMLANPRKEILEKGGRIFFGLVEENVIGTVALIKVDQDTFELAKLAVTAPFQGLKIGDALVQHCLHIAKSQNAKKIILYTSDRLIPAVSLYKKYNFKEVPLIHNKYIESDLKMELHLGE
jgi:ribosomal protein S18 acetylase RimI-like enzyme